MQKKCIVRFINLSKRFLKLLFSAEVFCRNIWDFCRNEIFAEQYCKDEKLRLVKFCENSATSVNAEVLPRQNFAEFRRISIPAKTLHRIKQNHWDIVILKYTVNVFSTGVSFYFTYLINAPTTKSWNISYVISII